MRSGRLRLLADVGGTNCRFAMAGADGVIGMAETLPVADFPRFEDALSAYLANRPAPHSAALAAAGPADGDVAHLTNAPWTISRRTVSAALGGAPVALFNDLEAIALSLPALGPDDLTEVTTGGVPGVRRPMLALNAGTGLGAAIATPEPPDRWRAVATEAGHMRFAAVLPEESRIAEAAVTYEDALAGRGHRLLDALFPSPEDRRRVYSGLFGRIAGDLVLATGAWGGVYLTGGVLDGWDDNIDPDILVARFCEKGPMSDRMAMTPIYRIRRPAPAMLGLALAVLE